MTTTQQKLDALTAFVLASSEEEKIAAQNILKSLGKTPVKEGSMSSGNLEIMAHELLMEIGVPTHLVGYKMVVTAIVTAAQNPYFTDDMTCGVYPYIAMVHDSTASKVERAIRHCVEVMYTRCQYETLNNYFGNTIDPNRGKPTNSQFISTLGNVLKILYNKQ